MNKITEEEEDFINKKLLYIHEMFLHLLEMIRYARFLDRSKLIDDLAQRLLSFTKEVELIVKSGAISNG